MFVSRQQHLPPEVATLAPGADLLSLLTGLDPRRLDRHDLGVVLGALDRLASHVTSLSYAVMAEFAHRPTSGPDLDADGHVRRCHDANDFAAAEIAPILAVTRRRAETLLGTASGVVELLPQVGQALRAGQITVHHATTIHSSTTGVDDRIAVQVADQAVGYARKGRTGPELRERIARLIARLDPLASKRRRDAWVAARRVVAKPHTDAVTDLRVENAPAEEAAAAWNHLCAYARSAKRGGDPRTMDQLRADAAITLLTGRALTLHRPGPDTPDAPAGVTDPRTVNPPATPNGTATSSSTSAPSGTATPSGTGDHVSAEPAVPPEPAVPAEPVVPAAPPVGPAAPVGPDSAEAARTDGSSGRSETSGHPEDDGTVTIPTSVLRGGTIEVVVPLTTLLGLTESTAELGGWGPLTADLARQVITKIGNGATWNYTVLDDNGTPITGGSMRRRPTQDQVRAVRTRYRRCVFPGCRTPSALCDLDHVIDYGPAGPTEVPNLAPLCRFHHRVKHQGGWGVTQLRPGFFRWRSAFGHTYITEPDPLLDEGPDHRAPPESLPDLPLYDVFGLPPGQALDPEPPPQPTREYPDVPPF